MTPAQRAKAEHIITGLRERERQLETRLAGWEYEALVLLQELAAEPVRVPVTERQALDMWDIEPAMQGEEYDWWLAGIRAAERKHRIGT